VAILAAQKPAQPLAPISTWDITTDEVTLTWIEPDNGGSPVTGYKVSFRQNDLVYSAQLSHCDMTVSTAVTCVIPVTVFKSAPFDLPWGASIYAKVIATNIYGDSLESDEGNGAYITTYPDPPTDLTEDYSQRTPTVLAFTWTPPVFTGGDVIIDYRVNIAEQGGVYSILAAGITETTYTATDLTSGVIYEFKVESRNSYDHGPYSEVITMLAAFKPEAPDAPTTTTINNQVKVSWPMPITNGSPITGYKVYILQHDGVTYT
jgi:hypothetical protein